MRPFSPDYANYTPTNEQRAEVRLMVRNSRPIEAISEQLDLPVAVLNYYFAKELESIPWEPGTPDRVVFGAFTRRD